MTPIMRKNRITTSLIVLPFILSGCSFKGTSPMIRNGDLLYLEVDEPNYFRDVNCADLTTLFESNSDYLLMFTRKGCSSCEEFKPIIENYIKKTNQVVYSYEISESDFMNEFVPQYGNKFFPSNEILTPALFVGEGLEVKELDHNRFMTKPMFTNLMRGQVYETNVYSFTRFNSYLKFKENNSPFETYIYDRKNKTASDSFNLSKEMLYKSENTTAIIDISLMDETNVEAVKSYYEIDEIDDLIIFTF